MKKMLFFIAAITVATIIFFSFAMYSKIVKEEKAQAEKVAAEKYAASHPPAQIATTEAFVLTHECVTPCSGFVGYNYKIQEQGDIRIKYNGCTDWFDQPAGVKLPAPACFLPGEAQFVSPKEKPQMRVEVYKKITVPI